MKTSILASAVALSLAAGSAFAANDRFVDVIVNLQDHSGPASSASNHQRAATVARGLGVQTSHTYGTVLTGFAGRVPEGRLDALRNDPRVASVEIDQPVYLAAPPSRGGDVSIASNQTTPWGVARVGGVQNNTGAGVRVYVLDTGIDGNHRDLNVVGGFAVETCKGGSCSAPWHDDQGHGTHVAGTIGALDNDVDVVGVAPGVSLYAVKVLNRRGSGTRSGVIAGVDWVAQQAQSHGPVIANMSLGGSGSKSGTCTSSGFSGTDTYHAAICNATRSGVIFAVAAGNDGANAEGAVPAAYDDAVITVSATNSNDDWTSWSNWGDKAASWTARNSAPIGIAAPGASILSTRTGGGTTTMSGTSMAAPHVAGGLALLLKANPQNGNYSAFSNLRSLLLNTAESTSGFSNTSGKPHDEDFLDVRGY